MDFSDIYKSSQTLEPIENYTRSDDIGDFTLNDARSLQNPQWVGDDDRFWRTILYAPEADYWEKTFNLIDFALCEWIPRIPGLYWKRGSKRLRELGGRSVEFLSKEYITFAPLGKSKIVLGGVGTLKLPPVNDFHLVCLSAGHNASSGIPTLISPDVWEYYKLRNGDILTVKAKWQKMSVGWTERFQSTSVIPRGYLVISDPGQIDISGRDSPVRFQPFTIMEYSVGSSRLYDFVYADADSQMKGYRSKMEDFFNKYKSTNERYGRYLIAADINQPMWEAEFDSPSALRNASPAGKAQLELLEARIRGATFDNKSIDTIVQEITSILDIDTLIRLSTQIQIPSSLWYTPVFTLADSAVAFLNICIQRNKVEEFIDIFGDEYPVQIRRRKHVR